MSVKIPKLACGCAYRTGCKCSSPGEAIGALPEDVKSNPELQEAEQQYRKASAKLQQLIYKSNQYRNSSYSITEHDALTEAGWHFDDKKDAFIINHATVAKHQNVSKTKFHIFSKRAKIDQTDLSLADTVTFAKDYLTTQSALAKIEQYSLGDRAALADFVKGYKLYTPPPLEDEDYYDPF